VRGEEPLLTQHSRPAQSLLVEGDQRRERLPTEAQLVVGIVLQNRDTVDVRLWLASPQLHIVYKEPGRARIVQVRLEVEV